MSDNIKITNDSRIIYKIMEGRQYRVFKNEFNGKVYYNILINQKNFDGTTTQYYRPVNFKKGINLDTNTPIIIKAGFENLRPNRKDEYNPISSIFITDFEIVQSEEKQDEIAYQNYQNNLNSDDLPF